MKSLLPLLIGLAILLILLSCLVSFAEDTTTDLLKNISINVDASSKKEYTEKLSEDDKKIAKAICSASAYAYYLGQDKEFFNYNMLELVVKKCRYSYDKEKPDITFVVYIKNDLSEAFANCDSWIGYYEAFYEK